jgi:hypothetical protein
MKEVLTKGFWRGVIKTFNDAMEGAPQQRNDSRTPSEAKSEAPPRSEVASPPESTADRDRHSPA